MLLNFMIPFIQRGRFADQTRNMAEQSEHMASGRAVKTNKNLKDAVNMFCVQPTPELARHPAAKRYPHQLSHWLFPSLQPSGAVTP